MDRLATSNRPGDRRRYRIATRTRASRSRRSPASLLVVAVRRAVLRRPRADPGPVLRLQHAGLAQYWNLLAGYAGLVSVGQQAFVGLGAYCCSR